MSHNLQYRLADWSGNSEQYMFDRRSFLAGASMVFSLSACGGGEAGSPGPTLLPVTPSSQLPQAVATTAALASKEALWPSSAWTGVAGSGFGTVPTDPTRETAKPAMRLLVPPDQAYTDTLNVGVAAFANNGGSLLDNLGIDKVIVYYEGSKVEIEEPTHLTFEDSNGKAVTYLGWWVRLKHDNRNGDARLYFEAVPKDGTMQRRIMGPYMFLPSAALYDYDLTVAPSLAVVAGSRYQSVGAALTYLRGVAAQRPRITITEPGNTYDLGAIASYTGAKGRCVIEASVPITFALTSGTKSSMRPRYGNLHFRGSNITFDMRYISNLYLDEGVATGGPSPVMDGVRFINSGGRSEFWDKGPRPISWMVRGGPWFLECTFDNTYSTCLSATLATQLVRGCTATNISGDAVSGAVCVIGSTFNDMESTALKAEINGLSVQYVGAGASATLALSGSNDNPTRTFTAKVAGATVGTFVVQNTNAALAAYNVSDVVNWLNTLSGWTATLLDNTRRATGLCLAGSTGAAFADTNVKTAALTLVTKFDLHPDFYQSASTGGENVIVADNVASMLTGQQVFLTTPMKDTIFVNNLFHRKISNPAKYYSQFAAAHSHVVMSHNTWTDQDVWLRDNNGYNPDTYCQFTNNVFAAISTTTADTDLLVANNHFMAGATARGIGATVGGTRIDLFGNVDAGDFKPQGALLMNLKIPTLAYDHKGRLRESVAAAGASV